MKENEQQFTDIVRRNRSTIYTVWHWTNVDSHNSHEHMVINRNRLSSHCHKCRYWHVVCVLWWWHRSLHWCSCCMVDIPKDAKNQWRNDKADWGNQQRINNPLFHHRNYNIQQATLHSGVAYFFFTTLAIFSPKNLEVTRKSRIFAEEMLHSANCKQAFFALVCIFFADWS